MTMIEEINAALDANKTVCITTYAKSIQVKAKHRAQWLQAGYEFFKSDSKGAPMMIYGQSQGKPRYACFSGAKVTAH